MELSTLSWILYGVIIFTTFIITILYFYMTRNFKYWKKRGVKEISPTPFVGSFGKYFKHEKSPGALFKYFYDQNQDLPYVGIYILDKPCLLIRDPELLKLILIKDFNYFSDKFMHSSKKDIISNNSLFFIENPYWKYVRQKFTALFTTGKMKSMFDNVREVGNDLDNYLDTLELEGSGKSVNITELAGKFTTDLIGQATYGLKLNSLKNPNAEFRKFGRAMFGTYNFKRAVELATVWLAPDYTTLFGFRFFLKSAANFFRTAFQDILDERKKSKLNRNDFIDLMIQLRDNENNNLNSNLFKFQGDNLLAQALTLFAAGYDTSSSTMSFALFELAKNQEMQLKLRAEINEAIKKNNGQITYEITSDLEYLDMFISEILRMYPTLPFVDRKTTKNYKIEKTGLVIEKGTPILIPMLGFHYDPKYFPNPHNFNPERFSSDRKSSINPYVYLPFGIGPRNCIGMRQGLLQTKLGIIFIISRFEMSLLENTCIKFDKLSVLSSSKGGIFLNVRKLDEKN
ncbi:cytochrome P450 6k1-like [Leptopilina boulardi]|uniref:cytochrome P450 6k1-like n=1 Tax=Leptopilina boulardi TaxID=63433 RepID=UPI0021F6152E|nr:cytochrome P450 6k1-like [Leptopilina boulardi]XP_051155407.1 cytochrome P450 6k1-like [Leptopilina boulardi]